MPRSVFAVLILTLVLAAAGLPAGAQDPSREVDLRGNLDHLPYTSVVVPRLIPTNQDPTTESRAFLFLDFNGDGRDDLVRTDSQGLVVVDLADSNRILQTRILDPAFSQPGRPAFSLSQCPDLTGDGHGEIIAIGHSANMMNWQLWVLDSRDLSPISTTSLPLGKDVRQDGRWDGVYRLATCLSTGAAARPPLVIVTCDVGHDQEGRGVLGINPLEGRVVWFHEVAGVVRTGSMVAGDLDHDGHNEIVMAVSRSTLPRSRQVNGYLDTESQVVVLNEDGTRRWSAVVTEGFGGCQVTVADANADGQPEVVAVHWALPVPSGGLHVWNLAGELLAEHRSDQPLTGLAILTNPARAQPDILVTTARGNLDVFQFQGRHLATRMRLLFPYGCAINGVVDLLPENGPEVVVTDKTGRTVILSAALEPLARITTSPLAWRGPAGSVKVGDGPREMYRVGVREGTISFQRQPVARTRPDITIAFMAAVTILVVVWLGLRYRRRHLGPDLQHEVRLHLLESLELSRHGDIAPLNAVRRLEFCLRALLADIGDNTRVKIRLSEILTECLEVSLPHLRGIMDRARMAGLDSQTVEAADDAVTSVIRLVHKLAAVENLSSPDEAMVADLGKVEKAAANTLRKLQQKVASFFQTDPQRAIERALLANRDRLQQAGVELYGEKKAFMAAGGSTAAMTVPSGDSGLPPGTCCLIAPLDLDQVLDNVIANATQSMRNSTVRQLRIEQKLADGMVLIDITDTGCGIAAANQDRALNTLYSTKAGGGTGLPAGRKILNRYGGRIMILRSEPGRGTTIRITTMAS